MTGHKKSEVGDEGEILGNAVVAQTVAEDPLARFIAKHWPRLLVVAIVGVLGMWVANIFEETRIERLADGSLTYARVHRELDALNGLIAERSAVDATDVSNSGKISDLEKQIKDGRARLDEIVRSLGDAQPPYGKLSGIYQNVIAAKATDLAVLDEQAARFEAQSGGQGIFAAPTESIERFTAELQALALARGLLQEPTRAAKGRGILKALADNGVIVPVAAAVALAKNALTQDDRQDALKVLEALLARLPEQREFLEGEISALKG